jgi:hypothetical protein
MQAYGISYKHFQTRWKQSEWVRLVAVWNEKPEPQKKGMKVSDLIGR